MFDEDDSNGTLSKLLKLATSTAELASLEGRVQAVEVRALAATDLERQSCRERRTCREGCYVALFPRARAATDSDTNKNEKWPGEHIFDVFDMCRTTESVPKF